MNRPDYFEEIRSRAEELWTDIENNIVHNKVYNTLLNQVKYPNHLISELMQNADDAGATEVTIDIVGDEFIFTHDGKDFSKEEFSSLCSFAVSNKKSLHTIGFRGIGFKSTFSIGNQVKLFTPTLSVMFDNKRFTEPVWIDTEREQTALTEIRIPLENNEVIQTMNNNLEQWIKDPTSLLFFSEIRALWIKSKDIRIEWETEREGPVPNSKWVCLNSNTVCRYLYIQSEELIFPDDCFEEIKKERDFVSDEVEKPSCHVEIVLGLKGQLYVVLPTDIKTELPFACNAPFILDPARMRPKELSSTNRWLLKKVGDLAANAMKSWLSSNTLTTEERAAAYDLLPDVDRNDTTLEGQCASIIEKQIESCLDNFNGLLSETNKLEKWGGCCAIPKELYDIWSPQKIEEYLFNGKYRLLSRWVNIINRKKLRNWSLIEELSKKEIITTLEQKQLPKPPRKQVVALWYILADEITRRCTDFNPRDLNIVPVNGKEILCPAKDVVRLGEKGFLDNKEDWVFLSKYLNNELHKGFLSQIKHYEEKCDDTDTKSLLDAIYRVLEVLVLKSTTRPNTIFKNLSNSFFSESNRSYEECIQLAQIAARLKVTIPDSFMFVTNSGALKSVNDCIVADIENDIDDYVSKAWYNENVLHHKYNEYRSCTREAWDRWIKINKIPTFIPLRKKNQRVWHDGINKLLMKKGCAVKEWHYSKRSITIIDWDFTDECWQFWKEKSITDDGFWSNLMNRIVRIHRDNDYISGHEVEISQTSTHGNKKILDTDKHIQPDWIMNFRGLPCIKDTKGVCRKPNETFLRTIETEPFIDIESFVFKEIDTEYNRDILLALGVNDSPPNSEKLMGRIRDLSKTNESFVYEIGKWYNKLDQYLKNCTNQELDEIKSTFKKECLILTNEKSWVSSQEVYLGNADNIPDTHTIYSEYSNLKLWERIGVRDKPSFDSILAYLESLEIGQPLTGKRQERVRNYLAKYTASIGEKCNKWLDLKGRWVPIDSLTYYSDGNTKKIRESLFDNVKIETAEFDKVPDEIRQHHPFSRLRDLRDCIEERLDDDYRIISELQIVEWITALGSCLKRVVPKDQEKTERIRNAGLRLKQTKLLKVSQLMTVPYIDSTPVGFSRSIKVLWKDNLLYVTEDSNAKLIKAICKEMDKEFNDKDVFEAILYCSDRQIHCINDYFEQNFELISEEEYQGICQDFEQNQTDRSVKSTGHIDQESDMIDDIVPPEANSAHDDDVDEQNRIGLLKEQLTESEPNRIEQVKLKTSHYGNQNQKSLIERYANKNGYKKEGDRFVHPNGNMLQRCCDIFHWERIDLNGEIVELYWVKEECWEHNPIVIDAIVWNLLTDKPDKYSLILIDKDGIPLRIKGTQIREYLNEKIVELSPAKYRVTLKTGTK